MLIVHLFRAPVRRLPFHAENFTGPCAVSSLDSLPEHAYAQGCRWPLLLPESPGQALPPGACTRIQMPVNARDACGRHPGGAARALRGIVTGMV